MLMSMCERIDKTLLVPTSQMHGEDEMESSQFKKLASEARQFLLSFNWCKGIKKSYFGFGVGKVIGIFLFEIVPSDSHVDACIWVIVGNLPPAYISTDGNFTPSSALLGYVIEMEKWVSAVKSGNPIKGLIPVNAPATLEFASMLERRLDLLKQDVIPRIIHDGK